MTHPLDPLSSEEIRGTATILRRDRGVGERWRFAAIELAEPAKGVADPPREALAAGTATTGRPTRRSCR